MTGCLFASDLHGRPDRYRKLLRAIATAHPEVVLIGGDLLPAAYARGAAAQPPGGGFVASLLAPELARLRQELAERYREVLLIPGNDDPRLAEAEIREGQERGLWQHLHLSQGTVGRFTIYGYACVPPTPFLLKDWERWDVSRHLDPGCVSPEEGLRTVPTAASAIRFGTIARDLEQLVRDSDLTDAAFLFHAPPYQTRLDRAGLDGQMVDGVPLDVHVGSIAVRRLIETRQPRALRILVEHADGEGDLPGRFGFHHPPYSRRRSWSLQYCCRRPKMVPEVVPK